VVFTAGAVLSYIYAPKYWIVGPIFGAVVIVWHWSLTRKPRWTGYIGFFLASTLIYALVIKISTLKIPETGLLGIFMPWLIAGTVLLPLAHKYFLKVSWLRVVLTVVAVYAITYGGGTLLNQVGLNTHPIRYVVNAITLWQGTYLACMFWPPFPKS
jgi:hypothetical protein